MLAVTDDAARLISRAAAEHRTEPRLRIRVVAGGCSGLTWDWEFCGGPAHAGRAERPAHPGDLRKTTGGVTIVVDPASAPYLRGASIGVAAPRPGAVLPMAPLRPLLSPGTGETITLTRLPARTTCGCGESFPAA